MNFSMARTKQTARGSHSQGSPARFSPQRTSDSDLPTSPLTRRPLSQARASSGGNTPAVPQGPPPPVDPTPSAEPRDPNLPPDPTPSAEPGDPSLPADPTPTAGGSKRVFGGKAAASKPAKKRRSTEVSPRRPLTPDKNRGSSVSTSKPPKKKPDRKTTATVSKAQAKKPTKAAKKTGTSGAGVVPPKRAPKAYNQVKNPERQKSWAAVAKLNNQARTEGGNKGVTVTKRGHFKPPPARKDARGRIKYRKRGKVALMEIRHYQKSTRPIIPARPFCRVVREICEDIKTGMRWQAMAVYNLQMGAESALVDMFELANLAAIHAKRITIFPKDTLLVKRFAEVNLRVISKVGGSG